MKYLFAVIVILVSSFSLKAQETFLLEENEPPSLKKDYSALLPEELNQHIDANRFLSCGLYNFRRSILLNDEVIFVYSLFPVSAYPGLYDAVKAKVKVDHFSRKDYQKKLAQLGEGFFANTAFHEPLYATIMPRYQQEFKQFSEAEAQAVIDKLKEGLQYARSFDLKKEDARFIKQTAYEIGKIKAFIYRRIKNKQLTQQECTDWLERIIEDLKSVFPDDEAKSYKDQYVLYNRLFGAIDEEKKYVWGKKFGKNKEEVLFVKQGEDYSLFFPKNTEIIEVIRSYGDMSGMKLITSEHNNIRNYHLFKKEKNKVVDQKITVSGAVEKFSFNFFDRMRIDYKGGHIGLYDIERETEFIIEGAVEKVNYFEPLKVAIIQRKDASAEIIYERGGKLISYSLEGKIKDIKRFQTEDNPFNGDLLFNNDSWGENYSAFSKPMFLLEFENDKKLFLQLKKSGFDQVDLPEGYMYTYISELNSGKFLVEVKADENTLKQGLLFKDGNWILEPIFTSIIDLGGAILVSKTRDERAYFALSKIGEKGVFLTGFVYEKPMLPYEDWGTDESGFQPRIDLNRSNSTLLMAENKYRDDQLLHTQHVLLNFEGEVVIPEKCAFIQRLNDSRAEVDYYKVAKKAKLDKEGHYQPASRLAIFNSQGEQLTKFKYDDIELVWGEEVLDDFGEMIPSESEPYFECTRNGKTIKLDQFGKPLDE